MHPTYYFKTNLKCEQRENQEAGVSLEQTATPGLGQESKLMQEEREAGTGNWFCQLHGFYGRSKGVTIDSSPPFP